MWRARCSPRCRRPAGNLRPCLRLRLRFAAAIWQVARAALAKARWLLLLLLFILCILQYDRIVFRLYRKFDSFHRRKHAWRCCEQIYIYIYIYNMRIRWLRSNALCLSLTMKLFYNKTTTTTTITTTSNILLLLLLKFLAMIMQPGLHPVCYY